jgi:hypothetical protein
MSTRQYPTYTPVTTAEIVIPLARALITGGLAASLVTAFTVFLAVMCHWPALVPLFCAFGVFSSVATWQWIKHITAPAPALSAPTAPAPALPVDDQPELRIQLTTKAQGNVNPDLAEPGDVIETFGLHIRPALLAAVIRSCESGAHQWSYRSLSSIPGVSETVAVRLLDELLEAGLLEYRNGQKNHPRGHELTASGRAIARHLSS